MSIEKFLVNKSSSSIFILCNKLNTTCGISSHIYYMLGGFGDFAKQNVVLITGGGDAVGRYRSLVKKLLVIPELKHEKRSLRGFISAIIKIRSLLKVYKPSVVHSHHFYSANIVRFADWGSKTVKIQTIHGIIPESGKLSHYSADSYIAVNMHIIDEIAVKRPKFIKRFVLIPYGYPFQELLKENLVGKRLKILTASRLVKEKGVDLLIEVIRDLGAEAERFEFFIAGEGNEEQILRSKSANLQVTFLGNVPDLFSTLGDYDILVNPTKSLMEGFPTIIVQAAAKRLALISTRFRGYDSNLNDENTFFIHDTTTEGFTKLLITLDEDRELLNTKRLRLHSDLMSICNVEDTNRQILKLYQNKSGESK